MRKPGHRVRWSFPCVLAAALALSAAAPRMCRAGDELAILTFPIGLIVGEHDIEVELGPLREPAELRLDGRRVCLFGGDIDRCAVDLGPDLRVHLLELIRHDESGAVTASASRWINRPGQEAELALLFAPREPTGVCRGIVLWLHPAKQDPSLLLIQHDARSLRIGDDGRSFAYPCPDAAVPNLLTASAIFPDGRRAEAVSLTGGFGGHEGVAMTAVPLVDSDPETTGCTGLIGTSGTTAESLDEAGFEVVFVLDPKAGYRGLLSSAGGRILSKPTWQRADASLWDADRIWIVMPDSILSRMDAYGSGSEKGYKSSSGKLEWLRHVFSVASLPFKGGTRIADAVAASGLVAAAGPWRRSIVLILGNQTESDASLFTPAQARAYLAEIGVPLHVLRIGKVQPDGWPEGTRVLTMRDFADALETLKHEIDQQCVGWFRGELRLDEIAASLPEGLTIAGRRDLGQ